MLILLIQDWMGQNVIMDISFFKPIIHKRSQAHSEHSENGETPHFHFMPIVNETGVSCPVYKLSLKSVYGVLCE